MNSNHLANLLYSDKTPIVLLVQSNEQRMYRGVAFIVRQKGKRVFIATNRHHFSASKSSPEEWMYMRGEKKFDKLQFCNIYYPESELEDYCIIELKAKRSFKIKMIPLRTLNEKSMSSIKKLMTVKNSFNGWGQGIELFNQNECSYRKEMKAIVHENDFHSTLYNLRNENDNKKYQALDKEVIHRESIVFCAVSVPGISGSPIIIQNGHNEYISIGINQGGTQGGDFGDLMYFVPASKIIKLLKTIP